MGQPIKVRVEVEVTYWPGDALDIRFAPSGPNYGCEVDELPVLARFHRDSDRLYEIEFYGDFHRVPHSVAVALAEAGHSDLLDGGQNPPPSVRDQSAGE